MTHKLAMLSATSILALAFAHVVRAESAAEAAPTEQLIVTAPRVEVKAREVQRAAPNLVNVQSAETIEKYPDFNAAEALGRIPGISISTDTGEGRFVNIRGIDGNLAGATFGGVVLLNTNPGGTYFGGGGRAVEYDTVPTGSIDGIIVTKTTLPDHEAEGLGGTVEITPRTAANITRPFLDATLGWGYEPAHDHTGPFNAEFALGARFGFNDRGLVLEGVGKAEPGSGWVSNPTPFSFVLTGSRRDDRRGFDDLEGDYIDPTVDHTLDNLQLRRYDYHRRRFGYGLEFDFKPNDDHSYYIRANVAGYREAVKKNRLTYQFAGNPVAAGTGFADMASLSIVSTDEEETHRNQVFVVGGKDLFGDVIVDYRGSYSRATFTVGKNYGARFTGPTVAATYDNSANNGDTPSLKVTDGTNINDPTLYKLRKNTISNSQEKDSDEEYAGAINAQFPLHLLNDSDWIKVGGELRLRNKSAASASQSFVISPLNLSAASTAAVTDFYEGAYTNGPQVATGVIRGLAAQGAASGSTLPSVYLTAEENIYAGYAQYSTKVGKWGFLAGVRVEDTEAKYGAPSDDGANPFPIHSVSYTDVFPTVQVRYDFSDKILARATWSTGVGRPGFNQVAAATSSNHDPSDPQISTGNPNLKPTTGDNFDLSFEYYLPNGGILQVGLFDKEFSNYIVTSFQRRLYVGTDPTFAGLMVGYSTYSNVSDAYARGIEAAYHQQFQWLPKPFDGFGIESNVTIVDSHINQYDTTLPGTSRLSWNLAGFYEAHGIQARLSAEYVSKELFSLGSSKAFDSIQDNRLTMDFTTSYRFLPNWTVYFNAKNLTNEPLRFYSGEGKSFPIQREIYDVTFEGGIRAKF